ncbi:NepR family anti-sigma factor [Zavarzinia sp. CC-PAN008]|uniref:NepR family anti-sigma factor n=1 Tax=Zavarzinia sp. CC-PAN008 TaxID=3243332 RepID=UPI003F7491FD
MAKGTKRTTGTDGGDTPGGGNAGKSRSVQPRGSQPEWLDNKLRALYEDVVQEPIPEEFLAILAKFPDGKDG